MHRSATAMWWLENVYFSLIFCIVDVGTASFGSFGGSASPNFFRSREIGRSRLCWAGEDFRMSAYPSRTYFWATARRASSTD